MEMNKIYLALCTYCVPDTVPGIIHPSISSDPLYTRGLEIIMGDLTLGHRF